jgi:predicted amidohydrolase
VLRPALPELSRALVEYGAEILAVPSAWVRGPLKEDHWQTLLRARAIENTCFVAGAGSAGRLHRPQHGGGPDGRPVVTLGVDEGSP